MSYELTSTRTPAGSWGRDTAARRSRCSLLRAVAAADRFDVFGDDTDEADPRFRTSLPRPASRSC